MSVSSSTINTAAMEKEKKYIQQSGNEYKKSGRYSCVNTYSSNWVFLNPISKLKMYP